MSWNSIKSEEDTKTSMKSTKKSTLNIHLSLLRLVSIINRLLWFSWFLHIISSIEQHWTLNRNLHRITLTVKPRYWAKRAYFTLKKVFFTLMGWNELLLLKLRRRKKNIIKISISFECVKNSSKEGLTTFEPLHPKVQLLSSKVIENATHRKLVENSTTRNRKKKKLIKGETAKRLRPMRINFL